MSSVILAEIRLLSQIAPALAKAPELSRVPIDIHFQGFRKKAKKGLDEERDSLQGSRAFRVEGFSLGGRSPRTRM